MISLLISFLQGMLIAIEYGFFEEVLGSRRFYIALSVFVSMILLIALSLNVFSVIGEWLSFDSVALIVGTFPGDWLGKRLGKMWRKGRNVSAK